MPVVQVKLECPFNKSFRTSQVAAMFDVPVAEKLRQEFEVEVPSPEEEWKTGTIVGASGTGKSSLAKQVFGDCLYSATDWPTGAMIDGFPKDLKMDAIVQMLTAVGFSSPPSWLKPYGVLSNGEKSRADLARSLLSSSSITVYDEYSSVVGRDVAKTMSIAVSKAIRAGHIKKRFVAVTCHADVLDWLCPDWVVDMSTKTLSRGLLRPRPNFTIEIFRTKNSAWELFKHPHYLSNTLHQSCQSYMALINGEPAAFCALLHVMGYSGYWRISRIVVLPDYQGIGIGSRLMEYCAQSKLDEGAVNVRIQGSHPSIVWHCDKHRDKWRLISQAESGNKPQTGAKSDGSRKKVMATSTGRPIVNFQYIDQRKR